MIRLLGGLYDIPKVPDNPVAPGLPGAAVNLTLQGGGGGGSTGTMLMLTIIFTYGYILY